MERSCRQRSTPQWKPSRRCPVWIVRVHSSGRSSEKYSGIALGSAFPGSRLLRLALLELHPQVGLDEAVEVAVEHRAGVAHLVVGAKVLDELVGLQNIRPDLAAERDFPLLVVLLGEVGLALLFFPADELRL